MKPYHVDRLNRLHEGENLTLFNDFSVNGEINHPFCDYVRKLYPEGISEHGDRYLFDGKNDNWIKEAHLENMRLRSFPESLSRFQSFFALSAEWVEPFLKKLNLQNESISIFEVDSENCSFYDMNLIDKLQCPGVGVTQYYAHQYWAGERSENPLLECLLP
ncbi:MAG: hypothetical protein PHS86_12195, partial [Syntrophaceae bacterium]|nr:hypothetical protein [Syntrophaceae bacterium]